MNNQPKQWITITLGALLVAVAILTSILLVTVRPVELRRSVPSPKMVRTGTVFLGDSLAQGVGATSSSNTLAARVHQATNNEDGLWNVSLAGATVAQVQSDQLGRLKEITPSSIYLVVGSNDVTGQTDPALFASTYESIVVALAAKHVPLILLNIPKLAATPAIPVALKAEADARTQTLNESIAKSAKSSGAKLIDVYTFSAATLTQGSGLLADDNYHPNDAGYAKLAALVLK